MPSIIYVACFEGNIRVETQPGNQVFARFFSFRMAKLEKVFLPFLSMSLSIREQFCDADHGIKEDGALQLEFAPVFTLLSTVSIEYAQFRQETEERKVGAVAGWNEK